MTAFDAIVLAGGRGSRMGGVDKAELVVAGERLVDRVLAAVEEASRIVVVGPPREVSRPVSWTLEETPGSGPVAALEAGLSATSSDVVVVLAVDMPFVDRALVRALVARLGPDGAIAVDVDGRPQYLCAAYRRASLRAALERGAPRSFRALVADFDMETVETARAVDVDRPDDLVSLVAPQQT